MSPLAVLHQRACPPSRATTCGVPRLAAATARHPHQRRMLSAAVRSGARNLLNRGLMAAPFAAAAAAMPSPAAAEGVKARTLEDMQFDNTFVRELPGDTETSNTLRQVENAFYSLVQPTPPDGEPYLVAFSAATAALLDLEPSECERPEFALLMSGAAPLPGSEPYAQTYGGHQFGSWAGQLGDGRAITLGEVVSAAGQRWELQLKGAGKTPYSRRADGRAVVRSSIREFIASEAMAALGVPTTRALCCVGTGDQVLRDMFYNGNAAYEPGAVVCRVSPSFVRFGTFQLPVSRGGEQTAMVKVLADYVIKHHYPELAKLPEQQRYASLLQEVARRTGLTVAMWQSLGFVHGVLNTDNMSILGVTIDYGPYGFMDAFDPRYTPNTTDFSGRRYCYQNQPGAAQWNCVQLANALFAADLVGKEQAEAALEAYAEALMPAYNSRMAAKLGLKSPDTALVNQLLVLMARSGADFTNTFRALVHVPDKAPEGAAAPGPDGRSTNAASSSSTSGSSAAADALTTTTTSSGSSDSGDGSAAAAGEQRPYPTASAALAAALAAGLPQQLVDALEGDALAETPGLVDEWATWLRLWRGRLAEEGLPEQERQALQASVSPKFVPRQHLLQYAIEAAEAGDMAEVQRLLQVCTRPYDEQPDVDAKYCSKPPPEMIRPGVCVLSCSS